MKSFFDSKNIYIKPIVRVAAIQKQVLGQIWPMGPNLMTPYLAGDQPSTHCASVPLKLKLISVAATILSANLKYFVTVTLTCTSYFSPHWVPFPPQGRGLLHATHR